MIAALTQYDSDHTTSDRRGVAMILVLVALAMATIIGLSFLNTQVTTTGIAKNVGNQTHARAIAESAMGMAIDHLRTNATWRSDKQEGTWIANQSLDGGQFTIKVQDGIIDDNGNVTGDHDLSDEVTDHVVVTAIGYYHGVAHTILAEVTPQAGDVTPTKVVLVVGNASRLTRQEVARRAQLIEWGYDVTVVSANSSQSQFDQLGQDNDVFLVSETISSSKILSTGAGVVNEERALYDDFKLTRGNASEYRDTRIDVINNTHPITASLSTGVQTIFGSTQNMQYVYESSLPAGALVLANNPNNDQPALIVVEAGSGLQAGNAAGRRVFLPWGTNDVDFGALNANGLALLKNCIDWAAQQSDSPAPMLHYDFSEQSGEVIRDKYGNADLQIDRGDDNDAITWVTDPNGMGIQFNQDPDQGTAVCITSSPNDCQDLVDAIKQSNAVTVQVFFKQANGSSNGGYLLSMANMAAEDDSSGGDGGNGGGHGHCYRYRHVHGHDGRHGHDDDDDDHHGGDDHHGHGHGNEHDNDHGHGRHSLDNTATYSESVGPETGSDTVIYYSYHRNHLGRIGICGWSRRESSRINAYRLYYSRIRGYYYRRHNGDDDENDIPDNAPNLYDNFCIDGAPSGENFIHHLYMSHADGEVKKTVSSAWPSNEPTVYAFTFDADEGVVRVYVEGQEVASHDASDTNLGNWVSQWLTLGNSPSLSRPFVGTIYDVKIWDKQLSQSQLQDNAQSLLGDDEGGDSPNLLVLYEFDEVEPVAPQLISQWKLNDNAGPSSQVGALYGTGVSANDTFTLRGSAQIAGFRSSNGNYGGRNANMNVIATTNSTGNNKFDIRDGGTKIYGDALCGRGGNPRQVINVSGYASVTGSHSNAQLPGEIDVPTAGRPSYTDNYQTGDNYNLTLSQNLYCGNFTVKSNSKITINGDVTIWCKNFELKDGGSRIYVAEGASLTVYADGNVTIRGSAQLNYFGRQTIDAGRVHIFTTDGGDTEVKDGGTVAVANFYSTGHFTLRGSAKVYGTAACGKNMDIHDGGTRLYVDLDQVGGSGSSSGGATTTVAADEKGVSDGTYTNGPIKADDGKFDSAIAFDGDDDYVVMPHNDAYLINRGTISFWFNAADVTGTQGLFSKDSSGYDDGGHLTIYLDGSTLKATLQSRTTSYNLSKSGISTDTWYHVAVSFGPAGMKLILNGNIVDTDAYTGGLASTSGGDGNHEPIVIGAASWNSGNQTATPVSDYFHGMIDDVRIYGSPLTTTQIATVMQDGYPDAGSAVGLVVKDTGGYGEPLDMTVVDPENITWDDHGGMVFTGPNRAVSDTAASKIATALKASGAMTIEVIFTPDNIDQVGNIASISTDNYSRNMTVSQDAGQYDIRLRTTTSDSNGSPAVQSSDDALTTAQQHLVITWDGTTMKVYRNGQLESTSDRDGLLTNWSDTMHLIFGNEADGSQPWEGFLERFAIYDQALNSLQVQDVFNGEQPRDNTQTQAMEFHVRWYENP